MNNIRLVINIFTSDNFIEKVAEYYNESIEYVRIEDIREFIDRNIDPAVSLIDAFEVEGGDTDGWFVQEIIEE